MVLRSNNNNHAFQFALRMVIMLAVSFLVGLLAWSVDLERKQVISCSIFIVIIMATLLFWKFRLAIAFVGIGALMGTNVLDLPTFIRECKIDVILFLVGMMVTVGVLKELGVEGRGTDVDGDGYKDSGENFFTANTFKTRDVLRQTIVDYMHFLRLLKALDQDRVDDLGAIEKPDQASPEELEPHPGPPVGLLHGSRGERPDSLHDRRLRQHGEEGSAAQEGDHHEGKEG